LPLTKKINNWADSKVFTPLIPQSVTMNKNVTRTQQSPSRQMKVASLASKVF